MLSLCSTQLGIAILVSLTSLVCLVHYLRQRRKRLMVVIPRKLKALCGESEMLERNELSLCRPAHVPMSTCLQPKNAKLSSKPNQGSSGALKTGNMVEKGLSAKLQPEGKERQQEVLELDMKQLMIEEDTIDRLELNLKHKVITYFWGITTPFEESIMLMIPKSPPDPPASGAQIEHVVREITFIDSEIKQRLEWHIIWKKLQHNWDYPVPIQISQETFIPTAPNLIEFQLKIRLGLAIVHVPAEPVFLPDGHLEIQELHIKKSNKNCKLGLPKSTQLSVSHFIPADLQRTGIIIQPQKQSMSAITVSPKCKDKMKSCSKKQCHNINMLYRLPDIVPKFCIRIYHSCIPSKVLLFLLKLHFLVMKV
ncbi:uncharacterized protein LOC132390918 [Hypanus sabinus]|uniref:uncharacterized protein LOC132390918 n=1 Tax=Hypanus sabinus TaxID=79690 RepID=UPI0028C47C62|nr:uncharacterized protein LOC132390918 [Hypanus sabinus]